jgi:hypothetical protein
MNGQQDCFILQSHVQQESLSSDGEVEEQQGCVIGMSFYSFPGCASTANALRTWPILTQCPLSLSSRISASSAHFEGDGCRFFPHSVLSESFMLQSPGELRAPAFYDRSLYHDVDPVRSEDIEDTRVVGNDDGGEMRRPHAFDSGCDDAQGVDVEAGVGFVQDGEGGREQGELEDLGFLLLSSAEAGIQIPLKAIGLIFSPSRAALCADAAAKRKDRSVTPEISRGYWKARKTPAAARSSVGSARRSLPRNDTVPPSTAYCGCPMSTWARVDLPEPFGPMIAWISPAGTVRESPRRMGFPETDVRRSLMTRVSSMPCQLIM